MVVIPAIDLKAGRCVRLWRGLADTETVFSDNPAAVARKWEKEGALALHVVDLDGALEGSPKNLDALRDIVMSVGVPVQFGGGLRTAESLRLVFGLGVKTAIVGTRAVQDEGFLSEVAAKFGDSVMVSIDVSGGLVAVKGWTRVSRVSLEEFARKLKEFGLIRAVITDVQRDGTLSGPNLDLLKRAVSTGLRVIAAGGITTVDDVRAVSSIAGVEGCVIGKALYVGSINLAEAIRVAAGESHGREGGWESPGGQTARVR